MERRDGAYFDSFPQINLYPAVIVQRRDGKLIPIVDPRRGRIPMPHRHEDISQHIAIIAQASDLLLRTVNDELGTAFGASALTSFQGFPIATMLNASAVVAAASPIFIKSVGHCKRFSPRNRNEQPLSTPAADFGPVLRALLERLSYA
jgi:hypothetical protein